MGTLDTRVAIVTGGGSGIGRATAFALAAEGAVVAVVDRDEPGAADTVNAITASGGEACSYKADVSDPEAVTAFVDDTVRRFGGLDIAFNNAGIEGETAPTGKCTHENWARVIAVNLTGAWLCMRAEIPHMLNRGRGSIVNCSSIAGLVGFLGIPAYVASKHGVVGLTKAAALEYAQDGIRVNAVCPGVIRTPMVERFTGGDADVAAGLEQSEPVGRMGGAGRDRLGCRVAGIRRRLVRDRPGDRRRRRLGGAVAATRLARMTCDLYKLQPMATPGCAVG